MLPLSILSELPTGENGKLLSDCGSYMLTSDMGPKSKHLDSSLAWHLGEEIAVSPSAVQGENTGGIWGSREIQA